MNHVHSGKPDAILGATLSAVAPGAMVLITRLSRETYRRATDDVRGMNLTRYMVLNNLREQGGTTQQALGGALHLDADNCVLLLNSFEAAHLAVRRRDPDDRRRHIVEITQQGDERSSAPIGRWKVSRRTCWRR